MLQKICDRCGAVIPATNKHMWENYRIYAKEEPTGKYENDIEVCNNCYAEFVNWIIEGKNK